MSRNHAVIVEGEVFIQRSPEDVFDYCTDLTREVEWNPKTRRIERLTAGPVALGTQFEGEWIKGDPMRIEFVAFEAPESWETVGRSRHMVATSEGRVSKEATGTRLHVRMELEPHGILRPLRPLLGPTIRRREQGHIARIKAVLEGGHIPRQSNASGRRHIGRGILDALSGLPLFATDPIYRHWHTRWGATEEEVHGPMAGDEIVPKAQFNATRAITIEAPPEKVWPWIVQMGYRRAGFYTYALLDNAGYESADHVLEECQTPKLGDWVPMAKKVNATTAFKVKAFETNEWLLWEKPDSTWAWKLIPLERRRTRLISRLKVRYVWRKPGMALFTLVLIEFGDFPMMRRVLKRIKARAEWPANEEQPALDVGASRNDRTA
jgi:Polyketide cyclase / dehydrase and lipid transport